MKQTAIKVFLACAFGAFIGTLVAMHSGVFWFAGLLFGGLVGYLSYEFKEVVKASKRAYGELSAWRPNWGNYASFLIFYAKESLHSLVLAQNFVLFFIIVFVLCNLTAPDKDKIPVLLVVEGMEIACVAASMFSAPIIGLSNRIGKEYWKSLFAVSPLNVLFLFISRVVWPFLKAIPYAIIESILFIGRFSRRVLILIYSEIRLLCGLGAMLGALIGYFYWSPLLGALVGGLLGVANYYFISVKLLKLVPVKSE